MNTAMINSTERRIGEETVRSRTDEPDKQNHARSRKPGDLRKHKPERDKIEGRIKMEKDPNEHKSLVRTATDPGSRQGTNNEVKDLRFGRGLKSDMRGR